MAKKKKKAPKPSQVWQTGGISAAVTAKLPPATWGFLAGSGVTTAISYLINR